MNAKYNVNIGKLTNARLCECDQIEQFHFEVVWLGGMQIYIVLGLAYDMN